MLANGTRDGPGVDEALPVQANISADPRREDHRTRVGRERRERMRKQLLQSVLAVCSGRGPAGAAVIDDVVRHASVSRGTFYNHFDSIEQAVSELGLQLADEMTDGILAVYDVLEDPILRTATGFQMFLVRAAVEPQWGEFIAHIGLLSDGHLFTSKIRSDIQLGVETGDYVVPSADIATDLLMGAKIEAIRRVLQGASLDYVQRMTSMVLRSFGVTPSKADKSVIVAYQRLEREAPGKIAWWRSIA